MTFAYILLTLVGLTCAVFALQNTDQVVIRFLTWRVEGPLGFVILLSLMGGLVFASVIGLIRHWKLRSRIRQLEAKLEAAERPTIPPQV
jgi:uncharacterized integral membrane protein